MRRGIRRLVEELGDEAVGAVLVVLAALVLHDVALSGERLLVHVVEQETHAVTLQPERELEPVARHRLVVVRAVLRGRAVDVRRAGTLEVAEVRVFGHVLAALEHHVLEEVREAVPALRLVLRPDVVPDVDGDDGRAVILVQHHPQAVGQAARPGREGDAGRVGIGGAGVARRDGREEQRREGRDERAEAELSHGESARYSTRRWVRIGSTRLAIVERSLHDTIERLSELPAGPRVRELRAKAEGFERALRAWSVRPHGRSSDPTLLKLVLDLNVEVMTFSRGDSGQEGVAPVGRGSPWIAGPTGSHPSRGLWEVNIAESFVAALGTASARMRRADRAGEEPWTSDVRTLKQRLAARSARRWSATPLPECFAGETRIETRNTCYLLRDGVCHAVSRQQELRPGPMPHPSEFVGMRVVGWLLRDAPHERRDPRVAARGLRRPSGDRVRTGSIRPSPSPRRAWPSALRSALPCPLLSLTRLRPGREAPTPPPLPFQVARSTLLPQPVTPPSWIPPAPGSMTRLHLEEQRRSEIPPAPETPTPPRRSHRAASSPPPLASGRRPMPLRIPAHG